MRVSPGERLRAGVASIPDDPSAVPHCRLHALGWATVELDRAASELTVALGLAATAFIAAADSAALGARCRIAVGALPGGLDLVILEPATEGRLAAALARADEGPAAAWLVVDDPAASVAAPASPGPFGAERLVPGGPVAGLRRFLIGPRAGTIRP